MKKLFLILILTLVSGWAWALPEAIVAKEYAADTQVKASSGYVYSVVITFTSAAVGDEAWLFDAASATPNTAQCHVTAATANATAVCGPYTSANYFDTAIFFGFRSSGKVTADIQWI